MIVGNPRSQLWSYMGFILVQTITAHEGHEHYIPKAEEDGLRNQQLTRDVQHIKEDIEKYFQMNFTNAEVMSPKHLEYYYFVLHDFDKNNKLDGLEMLKAIQHVVEHEDPESSRHMTNIGGFASAIDSVLNTDDLDQDGFLSYEEYAYAQQRHASPEPPPQM